MTSAMIFGWGMLGSVAVPIVQAALDYDGQIAPKHRDIVFHVLQVLLAVVAGGLAVAHAAGTPLLALHIGAATPLIVQGFAKREPG